MKRKILLFALLLAVIISAFSVIASAEECTTEVGENVAKYAVITPTHENSASWYFLRPQYLVDGKTLFGTMGPTGSSEYTMTFTYDEERLLSYTTVYCNGSGYVYMHGPDTQPDLAPEYEREQIKDKYSNAGIQVRYLDADGVVVYDSGKMDTTELTSVTATPDYGVNAKSVEIIVTTSYIWGGSYLWEVEIYEQLGDHQWVFESTTANCTEAGVETYSCECGVEKTVNVAAYGHEDGYEWLQNTENGTHYLVCPICEEVAVEQEHVYDNACDASCDLCAYERDIPGHEYKFDCSTQCMHECGYVRTAPTSHTVSGVCDEECDLCGEATGTTVKHSYDNNCDTDCNACGLTREIEHTYSSECDTACNICGFSREALAEHEYNSPCDTDCNNCSEIRVAPVEHAFSGDCDSTCNTSGCGYERATTVAHKYSSDCDRTCNKCSYVREASDHVYDNACDDTCNNVGCGYIRTVSDHAYDNNCDTTCNVCGHTRIASLHNYSDWHEISPATTQNTGLEERKCLICGYSESRDIPVLEESGNAGMIVAIVLSCVAVIGGCAGVAVYFLVIKKK